VRSRRNKTERRAPLPGQEEEEEMKMKRAALMLVLLGSIIVVPVAKAQVKHIEMRVEGMT
jgi:hypothetical protein